VILIDRRDRSASALKIAVRVKTRSRSEEVSREGDGYVVKMKEPPVEGRANRAVLRLLAGHLGVPESRLRMVSGFSSRNKVIEVIPPEGGGR
jgi:uncharacterized protein YggU (UPF0235/DUF167 family)